CQATPRSDARSTFHSIPSFSAVFTPVANSWSATEHFLTLHGRLADLEDQFWLPCPFSAVALH
ncbi:MAG: hypothetical protein LAQ69_49605, partial [Acidobacteriia bacterium]|nr:hypothetical protein [Terriglobia bacterium]